MNIPKIHQILIHTNVTMMYVFQITISFYELCTYQVGLESGSEESISIYNPRCPESAEPVPPACSRGWIYFNGEEWAEETGITLTCLTGNKMYIRIIVKSKDLPKGFEFKNINPSMPVILDYPYVENKVCAGEYIKTYPTLKDAKAGCNKNDECGSITDITCNNENLKTCKGVVS